MERINIIIFYIIGLFIMIKSYKIMCKRYSFSLLILFDKILSDLKEDNKYLVIFIKYCSLITFIGSMVFILFWPGEK